MADCCLHNHYCRRCGGKIPRGDNGHGSRSLAVYCETCADAIAARRYARSRRAPPVFARRVATRSGYIEYRGTWPHLIFQGREIIPAPTNNKGIEQ